MARLVKTAAGNWKVRYYDGTLTASGKPRQRASRTFDAKTDAMVELRAIEREARDRKDARRTRGGRPLGLGAILTLWGQDALASRRARSSYVEEAQGTLTHVFREQRWEQIRDVTSAAVSAWRGENNGVGTDKPLAQLKAVMRFAATTLKQRIDLDVLLVPGRRGVRRRQQPPLLSVEQVAQVIARGRERGGAGVAAILTHLAIYGCRPIDACRARVRDFDVERGTLTLRETKNGLTVTHPLMSVHVEQCRAMVADRQPNDALFLSPRGEGWRVTKSAQQLVDWYVDNVSSHLLPRPQWGLYLLKDYAISTMDINGIEDRTKMLFTGILDPKAYAHYKATNAQRARDALAKLPTVVPQSVSGNAP